MRKTFTWMLLIVICLVLLLGALLIWSWNREIKAGQAEQAVFMPAQSDQGGVDVNSAFTFTFAEKVSSASVNKCLTVDPAIEVGVHQGANGQEVLVAPAEPLSPGTVYKFTLTAEGQSYTWAVQTKTDLRVKDYRPADRTVDVPVHAAVEIVFNQMLDIDPGQAAEYFSISPEVRGSLAQQGRALRFIPEEPLSPGTVYRVELLAGLPAAASSVTLAEGLSFSFETAPASSASAWQAAGPAAFLSSETPAFTVQIETPPGPADSLPVMGGQLYAYRSAESYINVLAGIAADKPVWSRSFQELRNCPVADALPVGALETLALVKNQHGYALRWTGPLTPGYYLLRLYCQGDSRDLLFVVSDLTAYLVNDSARTLLWLHDASSREPARALVREMLSGVQAEANSRGLVMIDYPGGAAIYAAEYGGLSLVLPLWENQAQAGPERTAWRYLYADKSVYAEGETLYYWGLLQPRGDWQLAYENVSVYIVAQGQDIDNYICRDVAPLANGLFSGNLILPELREGAYQLQVRQSGVLYLAYDFIIEASGGADREQPAQAREEAALSGSPLSGRASLTADSPAYAFGQSFTVTGKAPGASWLFIEAEGGITTAVAGEGNLYLGAFQPKNLLDSYVLGIASDGAHYYPAGETRLCLDYQSRLLHVDLLSPPVAGMGGTLDLKLQVTDSAGRPLASSPLFVQVVYGEKPRVDTAAAIYGDYGNSGLSTAAVQQDGPSLYGGDTIYCSLLTTDQEGKAAASVELATRPDSCYVAAQSIVNIDGVIAAGSLVKRLAVTYAETAAETTPPDPAPVSFGYRSGLLSAGSGLELTNGGLLIVTTPERREILEFLLAAACAEATDAEGSMSAAHARQLLIDYGGDAMRALFGAVNSDCGAYQKPDGGLGDPDAFSDPLTSAQAAAMAPTGLAWHELNHYFNSLMAEAPGSGIQALALAGLAASGKPVLTEVNLLLSRNNLDPAGYWWLLWALYNCGDRQTALSRYRNTPAENREAAAAGPQALVAAACGDSAAALKLLRQNPGRLTAERVLIARLLLNKTLQPEIGYSYCLDGQEQQGALSSMSDLLLSINGDSHTFSLENSEGQLAYIEVFVEKGQVE